MRIKTNAMGQLIVRNLDNDLVAKLKQRAAAHGRSTEAEHRAILHEAIMADTPKRSFKEALLAMPDLGDDCDFERTQDVGRSIKL